MPPLPPRSLRNSPTTRLLPSSFINRLGSRSRPFSTHPSLRLGHPDGDAFYDPPTGWLFGVPPGEKYKKEGWENIWVYGYWGSCLLAVVAYIYKPDTSWVSSSFFLAFRGGKKKERISQSLSIWHGVSHNLEDFLAKRGRQGAYIT